MYSVSNLEAIFYYSVLPSNPILVYRTGTTPWTKPTGLEAYRELKELRPVFGHKLNTVWKDLGPKVRDFLDSVGVLWTTIDVVRFVKVGKGEAIGPVVLWIGRLHCGHGCLDLLKEFEITNVEVEYRESIYTRSAGPNLLRPVSDLHPTVDATPHAQGTRGLYLAEGDDSKKVLLVTVRHVLFPSNEANVNYAHTNTSAPRRNVLFLGTKAFDNLIKSIQSRIEEHCWMTERYKRQIKKLQEREAGEDKHDVEEAMKEQKKIRGSLNEAIEVIEPLHKFCGEVMTKWSQPSQRVLGHVVHSPPITLGAGTEGFTEDYAIVELNRSKIREVFRGNMIDLGTKIPFYKFTRRMYSRTDVTTTFKYPDNRLLELRDPIEEDEMRNPDMLDHNGEPCLLAIKNGCATGVTVGCATGIFSFVREYLNNGTHRTSVEWAILPYDNESGVFSASADSGIVIVDGRGRIGGLLTGGAGKMDSLDVTYATPFFWLLPRIKENGFPDAHLYPIIA
ncbi:hypothetical protein V8B97DRAFT_2072215 [Scleroderma yunnanense]